LVKAHEVQLVNYLTAMGKDIGLILNFGEKGVEVIRKIREPKRFSELLKKLVASNGNVNLVYPVNPVKVFVKVFQDFFYCPSKLASLFEFHYISAGLNRLR
jgi:hypothetical protein